MKRIGWVSVIALFLGVFAFAYGFLSRQPPPNTVRPPASSVRDVIPTVDQGATPTDTVSTRAYREAINRMRSGMDIAYTGDPDVDFLRSMIVHQEGAIALAGVAAEYGEAPDVKGFAEEVMSAQQAEIIRMRILLARHEDAPDPSTGR